MTLSDLSIGLTNVPILLDLAGAEPTLAVPAATAPEDEEEEEGTWGGSNSLSHAFIDFMGNNIANEWIGPVENSQGNSRVFCMFFLINFRHTSYVATYIGVKSWCFGFEIILIN